MSLLTQGQETVLLYPEVEADDGYGTPTRVPSGTPITIDNCHMQPVSTSETQLLGQEVATVYRMIAVDIPGGAWAKVVWDGRDWEPLGEPEIWHGVNVDFMSLLLKSRGPGPVA